MTAKLNQKETAKITGVEPPDFNHAPSGFFVLRAPLLPFNQFLQWSDGLQAASSSGEREAGAEALKAYVRNVKLSLFNKAENIILYTNHD